MPVAVSISTQIVGNVQEGILRSESTVAHPGRTLVAVTTRITANGGKLLALVNSSHFIRQSDYVKTREIWLLSLIKTREGKPPV
jgi:hypothetical protein